AGPEPPREDDGKPSLILASAPEKAKAAADAANTRATSRNNVPLDNPTPHLTLHLKPQRIG
ncbi:MAG: hypothetical protein DSY37_01755, partial [Hyperthermus sp.]